MSLPRSRSDARRDAILDRLADFVLAEGLAAASLRPMARAAKLSDRMLLYYFKDKSEVLAATLERVAARLVAVMNDRAAPRPLPLDRLVPQLQTMLFAPEFWPYLRLWLEVAARSAAGDPLCREIGERIMRGFLAWGTAQLDSPTPETRQADAARLLATIEGMVVLKALGMDDVVRKAL